MTVIGLDAEWTAEFEAQGSHVDVLQLAVPGHGASGQAQAIILHLSHKDMKPPNGEKHDRASGVRTWPCEGGHSGGSGVHGRNTANSRVHKTFDF